MKVVRELGRQDGKSTHWIKDGGLMGGYLNIEYDKEER